MKHNLLRSVHIPSYARGKVFRKGGHILYIQGGTARSLSLHTPPPPTKYCYRESESLNPYVPFSLHPASSSPDPQGVRSSRHIRAGISRIQAQVGRHWHVPPPPHTPTLGGAFRRPQAPSATYQRRPTHLSGPSPASCTFIGGTYIRVIPGLSYLISALVVSRLGLTIFLLGMFDM